MKPFKTFIFRFCLGLFIIILQIITLQAQVFKRTAVTSFNVDNGLLQNSVTNLVVDKFGFVWFSSPAGIQRYDGSRYETIIALGNENAADKSANLNVIGNEQIWISHIKGITSYNPNTHRFKILFKKSSADARVYKYAGEDDNSVWYLSDGEALLQFSKKTGVLVIKIPFSLTDPLGNLAYCKQINNKLLAICMGYTLTIFNMNSKKIQYTDTSLQLINGFLPINESTILLLKEGYYYEFNINIRKEKLIQPTEKKPVYNLISPLKLMKNGNVLASDNKNIYELEAATMKIKTKWAGLNQEFLINSGYISGIYLDGFNQLWVLTNSDGIKKINFNQQPFQYYGTVLRKDNFIRCIYEDKKKGVILAGTYGSGLLLFDTSGYLLSHLPVLNNTITDVLSIQPLGGNKYLLLSFNTMCVFDIKSRKVVPLYIQRKGEKEPVDIKASYYSSLHKVDTTTFLFTHHYVLKFNISNGIMTDTITIMPKINDTYIYNYLLTKKNEYCFSTEGGLEFLDKNFKTVKIVSFMPRIKVRCMAQDNNGNIWLGTETGLYKTDEDGKLIKKYSAIDGLRDEGIYAIQASGRGIYFSHNKGLSFLNEDGRFSHYTRRSGLQENEFNTKSTFKSADGKLYFGGINGITAFYPKELSVNDNRLNVYATALEVMDKPWKDTAVWNIKKINLPHNENIVALRISIAAAIADKGGHTYQYKMEGLEPNWITTSGVDFIRYVLQPGKYIFKARISNVNAALQKETRIEINIAAPWWQQWWFIILAGGTFLTLTGYIIYSYNRKKYAKKIKQFEMEQRIQKERERISRDLHDNLGAYATAIVNNADKIMKNPGDNVRINNLKENAGEIMTNLRDTIWALNKNDISVIRFSDRINTYLQKMRDAYPEIKIEMQDDTDSNFSYPPEFALNVLRIIQEAFHNAVKHSMCDKISINLNIGKNFYISIKDNGMGLDYVAATNQGKGLSNMEARAKENNIQLKISSIKNEGTCVELFSPLQ